MFNIKDFGATGKKTDNAQAAIQKAIDACAAAGGGTVLVPAGEYTSGTIYMKSHVTLHIESGATIFASRDKDAYKNKRILVYAGECENIAIEGRGTLDGQSQREWREMETVDANFKDNTDMMVAMGKKLLRPYPVRPSIGLILLEKCKDVQIRGINVFNSSSWSVHPWHCERVVVDGVYIWTDLKAGVWADGLDIDGCKDVHVNNCTIETGDDAICLKAMNSREDTNVIDAVPCENITITNCRLTSSSAAFKYGDEIFADIKNVVLSNCILSGTNRGIMIIQREQGVISDLVVSNVVIDCSRREWFWWGDGDPIYIGLEGRLQDKYHDSWKVPWKIGGVKNVIIKDVIAYAKGSSRIFGDSRQPLENIALENVKIFISEDTTALQKTVHGLTCDKINGLTLKGLEIRWGKPDSKKWESALVLDNIKGLTLDGFKGRQAQDNGTAPAVLINDAQHGTIANCSPLAGTDQFLKITGKTTNDVSVINNSMTLAKTPVFQGADVPKSAVKLVNNATK